MAAIRRRNAHMPNLSSELLKKLVAECEKRGGNRIGAIDWSLYWIAKEILGLRKKIEVLQKRLERKKP